jgi:anti-sigma factor RsiW
MNTQDNRPDAKAGAELVRWLDGELSPHESEAMERRLSADASLRREAEVLSELEGLLEQRPNSGEAPDVRAAVLARIERDLNEDVGWRILPRFMRMPVWAASWAACGILLAFVVLGVVEMEPGAGTPDAEDMAFSYELAAADDDLSFADMIDEAFETSGTPVDSMASWLEEPTANAAPETAR